MMKTFMVIRILMLSTHYIPNTVRYWLLERNNYLSRSYNHDYRKTDIKIKEEHIQKMTASSNNDLQRIGACLLCNL